MEEGLSSFHHVRLSHPNTSVIRCRIVVTCRRVHSMCNIHYGRCSWASPAPRPPSTRLTVDGTGMKRAGWWWYRAGSAQRPVPVAFKINSGGGGRPGGYARRRVARGERGIRTHCTAGGGRSARERLRWFLQPPQLTHTPSFSPSHSHSFSHIHTHTHIHSLSFSHSSSSLVP